jgi:hypothetical protein
MILNGDGASATGLTESMEIYTRIIAEDIWTEIMETLDIDLTEFAISDLLGDMEI